MKRLAAGETILPRAQGRKARPEQGGGVGLQPPLAGEERRLVRRQAAALAAGEAAEGVDDGVEGRHHPALDAAERRQPVRLAARIVGDLRQVLAAEVRAGERAAMTAIRAETDQVKAELRRQVTTAFGPATLSAS